MDHNLYILNLEHIHRWDNRIAILLVELEDIDYIVVLHEHSSRFHRFEPIMIENYDQRNSTIDRETYCSRFDVIENR